jgi:hypothetical protein
MDARDFVHEADFGFPRGRLVAAHRLGIWNAVLGIYQEDAAMTEGKHEMSRNNFWRGETKRLRVLAAKLHEDADKSASAAQLKREALDKANAEIADLRSQLNIAIGNLKLVGDNLRLSNAMLASTQDERDRQAAAVRVLAGHIADLQRAGRREEQKDEPR